jgi:DUF2075 family protein
MVIYQENVGTFIRHCVTNQIATILKDKVKTLGLGAGSPSEFNSWAHSLPVVAGLLDKAQVDPQIDVALEYKLDVSKGRIDFLIYGQDEKSQDNVVVVELKQWSQVKKSNLQNEVLTDVALGNVTDTLHPSYKANSYASTLREFNVFVYQNHIPLESCSFCHNMPTDAYSWLMKDDQLFPFVDFSPAFLKGDEEKLMEFIRKYVRKPHKQLLYEIDASEIRPSKEFSDMLYGALKGNPFFTYDEEQALSVSCILKEVREAAKTHQRKTIIIKGGPGTGKSVVAINALGNLIHPNDGQAHLNACYCTGNYTPREAFSEILVDGDYKKSSIRELFKTTSAFTKSSECDFDCILVDEAHRAFKWKFGCGVKRDIDMIDKLFYASRVNVFFIDEDQTITTRDYLTADLIRSYAKRYGSQVIEGDDLTLKSEFRCLGGERYIAFINDILGYTHESVHYQKSKYDFQLFDSALKLQKAVYEKNREYGNTRIVAGYTHEWISKKDPEGIDPNDYDIVLDDGAFKMRWNKLQTKSYINDETQYDRVGCVHTVQGIDLNYCGVIIGKDLLYRDGHLVFNQAANARSDHDSGIRNADPSLAERLIRNSYKVLLTRGIKGTYLYCEDKALSEAIKAKIPI